MRIDTVAHPAGCSCMLHRMVRYWTALTDYGLYVRTLSEEVAEVCDVPLTAIHMSVIGTSYGYSTA